MQVVNQIILLRNFIPGNLMTCKWWSYTWLNEGFARYFQSFGTHMVDSEFDLDLQFVVDQMQSREFPYKD